MIRNINTFWNHLKAIPYSLTLINKMATRTSIPTAVVQLVASCVGETPMNDLQSILRFIPITIHICKCKYLTIGRALRINVNGGQIIAVWLFEIRLNRNYVQKLLSRSVLKGIQWGSIAGSTAALTDN